MSETKYPKMFSPIRIGNVEIPNRICHVPTDISSANADGTVNLVHYAAWLNRELASLGESDGD